jgi:hypothetical protein
MKGSFGKAIKKTIVYPDQVVDWTETESIIASRTSDSILPQYKKYKTRTLQEGGERRFANNCASGDWRFLVPLAVFLTKCAN